MIEFLSFFAYVIVITFIKCNISTSAFNEVAYMQVVNSTISLLLVYILFVRVFFYICLNKVWKASRRYFLLCSFYSLLLVDANLAILFFTGELQYLQNVTGQNWIIPVSQVFMYSISLVMFVYVKVCRFKNRKTFGNIYFSLEILDSILLLIYALIDALNTAEDLLSPKGDKILFCIGLILALIAFVNLINRNFKDYWAHKKVLKVKIIQYIKNNQETELIKPLKRDLRKDSIMREIIVILDKSPCRVLEVSLLVRGFHNLLIEYGHKTESIATEYAAQFNALLVQNLMKRRYDFCLCPSFIVNFLQSHNKRKPENDKRGFGIKMN